MRSAQIVKRYFSEVPKNKNERTYPCRKVCPDGRLYYALTPCGAPLNPSVIRGSKITVSLYHEVKKASRKQINKNYQFSKAFHVKVDKTARNSLQMCKNEGGSDNRPNIFSIPQSAKNVNSDFVRNHKICIMLKRKLFILYNIPSCILRNLWYDKHTKR